MAEFAIFIFDHLGAAAIVFLLGILADYFSTAELKSEVSGWIKSRGTLNFSRRNVSHTLNIFLDGFIGRIFGARPFSVGFFLRSCVVSSVFLVAAIGIQLRFYEGTIDQLHFSKSSVFLSFLSIVLILAANFAIDYLSNVQTISLLNMAAASGRILDTVVVFFADIALTVTLFTLVFPVGVVLSVISTESFRGPTTVVIDSSDQKLADSWRRVPIALLKQNDDLKISAIKISNKSPEASEYWFGTIIIHDKSLSDVQVQSEFLAALADQSVSSKVLTSSDSKVVAELKLKSLPLSLDLVKHLYYVAFRSANVTRDSFLYTVTLVPFTIDLRDLYTQMSAFSTGPTRWVVRCVSGAKVMVENKDVPQDCVVKTAIINIERDGGLSSIRSLEVADDHLPITPFFFTSFTISILFYAALLLIGVGGWVARSFGRLFSTSYLETSTKPFSLVGFVLFVAIEVCLIITKLII